MHEERSYDQPFQTTREPAPNQERRSAKKGGGLLEFLVILLVAFVLVFGFVRPFVVEAFYIPSESMVPTLEVGDRVLVNKFIYRFTEPDRGDIVVFEREGQDLIKRVVALPGDRISVRDGTLYVNGETRNEDYLNQEFPDLSSFGPVTVPEGRVFVMGDNRANSRDSRFIGPIPEEDIQGEAFLRFWPPGRIGLI